MKAEMTAVKAHTIAFVLDVNNQMGEYALSCLKKGLPVTSKGFSEWLMGVDELTMEVRV